MNVRDKVSAIGLMMTLVAFGAPRLAAQIPDSLAWTPPAGTTPGSSRASVAEGRRQASEMFRLGCPSRWRLARGRLQRAPCRRRRLTLWCVSR